MKSIYAISGSVDNMECKEERCSNCAFNCKSAGGYTCYNPESEFYGLYTEYNTSCEFWEDRNG